jgi:hypothetical protein
VNAKFDGKDVTSLSIDSLNDKITVSLPEVQASTSKQLIF